MCCYNKPELAKKLYRRMKKSKKIFYKVYEIKTVGDFYNGNLLKKLFSPYYGCRLDNFGLIYSNAFEENAEDTKMSREDFYIINRGIHVFLTLEDVNNWFIDNGEDKNKYVIVKVKTKPDDLLGCNKETAVFTKIEITKKEWDKAIKEI